MYKIAIKREAPSTSYIVLPVNPEELSVKVKSANDHYDLLEIGAVIIPGGPGLRTFTIASIFPSDRESGNYVGYLENLLARKAPVRLIITDAAGDKSSRLDINLPVVIDRFDYRERGGEIGAFFYELDLVEYREFGAEVIA